MGVLVESGRPLQPQRQQSPELYRIRQDAGSCSCTSQRARTLHTMNTYSTRLSGQTQPYLYLSSYGGQGYNIGDWRAGLRRNAPGHIRRRLSPGAAGIGSTYDACPSRKSQMSHTPIRQRSPPGTSYQIISPGGDQQYGMGGEYETANGPAVDMYPRCSAPPTRNVRSHWRAGQYHEFLRRNPGALIMSARDCAGFVRNRRCVCDACTCLQMRLENRVMETLTMNKPDWLSSNARGTAAFRSSKCSSSSGLIAFLTAAIVVVMPRVGNAPKSPPRKPRSRRSTNS